jgi:RNA polymerase sigma-70 factor (ECF subfamily)
MVRLIRTPPDPPATSPVAEGEPHDPTLAAVCEAKAGHPDGVRKFLSVIAPWVRRTCTGVLGAGHPDLDDTMQECLFAAVKALGKYRFEGDIRHYVTKITLRIAISARKSSAARWRREDALAAEAIGEQVESVSRTWTSDEVDLIRRILDRLSGVQSEAMLMRIVLGFSVEEIARTTGVSQNTVKTRLRLGKDALRKDLRRSPFWRRWLAEKRP